MQWLGELEVKPMKHILQITAVVFFALAISPIISAQPVNKDKERAENERDLELRSWNLRILALQYNKNKRRSRPQPEQQLAQLQKDFSQLQVLNKSLLTAALANPPLDPKFVSKSVAEIKKRAERLDKNLALPEPERAAEQTETFATPLQLKPSVLKLGRLIFSFVDNPFFKEASVVDTQLTSKARRDLEDIIELSGQIRKTSEQMGKANSQ
jgi:hypothetical protein